MCSLIPGLQLIKPCPAVFSRTGEQVFPDWAPIQVQWCGLFKWNLNHLVCKFFWCWPNMTSCFWGEGLKSLIKRQGLLRYQRGPYKTLFDELSVWNKKPTEFISFKMHVGLRIMEKELRKIHLSFI